MIARGIGAEGHVFPPDKLEQMFADFLLYYAEHIADRSLALSRRFEAICGQDTFGIQKPEPEVLRRTIHAACGSPQRAIMIGDSATDIRTARAAGVPVIAVDFGYSEQPVADFHPDRIISQFAELPAAIAAVSPAA